MASNRKRLKMDDEIASSSSTTSTAEEVTLEANFSGFTSNFDEIVETNCFVDKTLLIKTIFNTPEKGILITAPRRFGKSTNMDMVKKFVEIQVDDNGVAVDKETSPNRNIFKDNNLLIFQAKKIFNKNFATYPVIHASFKPVVGASFAAVLDKFRYVLHVAFEQHRYLLTSNKLDESEIANFSRYYDEITYEKLTKTAIDTGLRFLSKCLYKHFDKKKVFVLIDEYDAPINNTMFKKNIDNNEVNELLCTIFSETLKGNQFVDRALLTGISYFASVGLSGANNIQKYMFLTKHVFVPFYGLTENEVNKLLSSFKINDEKQTEVKLQYNGYRSLSGTKLYSIWSILKYLQQKEIGNYWEESGLAMNFSEAMNHTNVRSSIERLCLHKSIVIQIFEPIQIKEINELQNICSKETKSETKEITNPDIYLNFFLQQGYLTFDEHNTDKTDGYTVRVPNAEILDKLQRNLMDHYDKSISACIKDCAASFRNIFTSSEDEKFRDFISKFNGLLDVVKINFVKLNEDTYHCIMFSVLFHTKAVCSTEYTIPKGRTDLIVCKGDVGIIIELKYKKTSGEALEQIKTKYLHGFKHHPSFKNVTRPIYIGLNVDEHNVANISVLENLKTRHF